MYRARVGFARTRARHARARGCPTLGQRVRAWRAREWVSAYKVSVRQREKERAKRKRERAKRKRERAKRREPKHHQHKLKREPASRPTASPEI